MLQVIAACGLLGILAAQYWGYSQAHGLIRAAHESNDFSNLTQSLVHDLLAHNQGLSRFINQRDPASRNALDVIERKIGAATEALAGKPGFSETAAGADSITAYLAATSDIYAQVDRLGATENDGLQQRMRASVHAIETRLEEIRADSMGTRLEAVNILTITMLQMRRHEKDFMLRGDRRRYMDMIGKRQGEFLETLKAAPMLDRTKEELTRLLDDYGRSVNDYAAGVEGLQAAKTSSDRLFETASSLLDRLSAQAAEAAEANQTELIRSQERLGLFLLATVAGLLLIMLPGGFLLIHSIVAPLRRMTDLMTVMAHGDYSVEIPDLHVRDEVGDMACALEVFKANAKEAERLRAKQETIRTRADEERRQAVLDMADAVEREAGRAVGIVAAKTERMATDATGMAGSAERVSLSAQEVAAAAEQALSNAQTVASATEQLSASIREITGQVVQSAAVTREAVEQGGKAHTTIQSLSEAVGRIGEVAKLIGDIAGQTNLLALNATIEAARAGDAGKGFAVVASEVKNLATQTARSTEEIARQISDIQSVTASAVTAVDGIGEIIGEIDHISSAIAGAMEEQAAATREISRNVAETSTAAQVVSRRIAEVSGDAGAAGEQAAHVRSNLDEVATSIHDLRQVLVRVVRTSTDEADRRHTRRFRVNEPCTLILDASGSAGAGLAATVRNLSQDGAMVQGASLPAPGTRGTIRFDRHGFSIAFEVRSQEEGGIHLSFAADGEPALRQAIAGVLGGAGAVGDAA
jgi:methyl-accepting chemotaxis protein